MQARTRTEAPRAGTGVVVDAGVALLVGLEASAHGASGRHTVVSRSAVQAAQSGLASGVGADSVPEGSARLASIPNPFSAGTEIAYDLPSATWVRLECSASADVKS